MTQWSRTNQSDTWADGYRSYIFGRYRWIQAEKSWEGEPIPCAECAGIIRLSVGSVGQTNAMPSGCATGPGESTPDFLARAMREDHGFTVPGRSFLALDVVECQPKNAARLMAMRLAAIARLTT
ncbi:MAG: hypothetical protein QOD88_2340 [Mycobacterium sp.]|nr:hypothetical protein [Mycobacterium sp.]MDT5319818.1 hypothetical protein [Mycobacterium sp.]